ncbi:MAG: 4Fe-4S dicluster domain-containing protein [Nitrososphaerota archaeon]
MSSVFVPEKILVIDMDKCTGCERCTLACSFKKSGKFGRTDSRIRVFSWKETGDFIPATCLHCNPAPCQESCGVGAIHRDGKTGAVSIDYKTCINCKACMYACPYGSISIDTQGRVVKCDLCEGQPSCVEACSFNALRFEKAVKAVDKLVMEYVRSLKEAGVSKGPSAPARP